VKRFNQRKKSSLALTVGVISLSSSESKHFSVISGRGKSTDMLKRGRKRKERWKRDGEMLKR
jgi:hypothetical protein